MNQADAQPLFVVTAPANDDLIAMLRREILPEVRRLVGERRVTVAFDREGWSPKFFREVHTQGFDVLTYRKGAYAVWPATAFQTVAGVVDGRQVSYELAERTTEVLPGFRMREVRRPGPRLDRQPRPEPGTTSRSPRRISPPCRCWGSCRRNA